MTSFRGQEIFPMISGFKKKKRIFFFEFVTLVPNFGDFSLSHPFIPLTRLIDKEVRNMKTYDISFTFLEHLDIDKM